MKDFSRPTYNFSTISIGQKLTYSSFLILMLAGWLTMIAFYFKETGFSVSSLAEYYRGNEQKMLFPKTFYALWEVTHTHLFTIPVVFLILIHLFMLTRSSFVWKLGLLMASFAGMVLDIGTPWLIVYSHPAWAWGKFLGRILLNGSLLILIGWPIREMWERRRVRPSRHSRPFV